MTTKDLLESCIQRLSRIEAKVDALNALMPELESQRAAIQAIRSELQTNWQGSEGWFKRLHADVMGVPD
jgi:hypothetical protein